MKGNLQSQSKLEIRCLQGRKSIKTGIKGFGRIPCPTFSMTVRCLRYGDCALENGPGCLGRVARQIASQADFGLILSFPQRTAGCHQVLGPEAQPGTSSGPEEVKVKTLSQGSLQLEVQGISSGSPTDVLSSHDPRSGSQTCFFIRTAHVFLDFNPIIFLFGNLG